MITAKDIYNYWKDNREEFRHFIFTLNGEDYIRIINTANGEIGKLYIDVDFRTMIFNMPDSREDPFRESINDIPYYEIDEDDSAEYVLYKGIDLAITNYEILINKYNNVADNLSALIP